MTPPRGRIIFAGSPEFALPGLQAVADSRHQLVAVLTQPDRPSGRGRKLHAGPIKRLALDLGAPVLQPESLKSEAVQSQLRELAADLMVVIAYGLLLPPAVLELPTRGCVNVHASLLPRWRGAAPIQAAVRAGDKETGVCLMQLEAGLDTGPVYACTTTAIDAQETAGELHDRLAVMGGELLSAQLDALLAGSLQARPQSSEGVSYAGRINKSDGLVDWQQDAEAIVRQVLAFNPWPVAETRLGGERLRIWRAAAQLPATGGRPGEIVAVDADGVRVAAGRGSVCLQEIQMPGRKRMPAADFARGAALVGQQLGQ